ncbi:ABC transporter permease subunit [Rhodococcoides corynebacterioides]|uniref:ABC transporter permease subunit n=1 Tax=Rhodococcoides corynebacterioides TaxID=53972 RepID=UPI001D1BDABC|nr:ABC transporter permease subunit [Rhodococcus corynebacterioides]MBY6362987.1 ABC transporter permease subunit [Rhodococcus corynebacterioides]
MRGATAPIATLSRVLTAATLLGVVGLLPWLSDRDPALSILRARSAEQEPTPEALDAVRADLGLADGPGTIMLRWLGGVVRGDFGTSWNTGRDVLPGAVAALGVSATLMACAALVAGIVAAALVAPALRAGVTGAPRRSSGLAAAALTSTPEFLLASVGVVVGSLYLALPPYGWTGPQSAILPALALGLPAGGLLGRLLADAVSSACTEHWVVTWTAAGISRRRTAGAVLRRATAAVTSQMALVAVALLGGAVAVEQVFAIPGLGRTMLGDARSQDLPALQADVVLLLLVSVAFGVTAAVVRRLLLGASIHDAAVPVPTARFVRRRRHVVVPVAGALGVLAIVVAGWSRDPYAASTAKYAPPSASAPFGTDASGRDVLARVAHGAVGTIGTSLAVLAAAVVIGLVLGCTPRVFVGPIEVSNAAPPVVTGVLVASIWGPSAAAAALAVLLVSWAPLAAHTAALVAEVRARPYVAVLPALGASRRRILWGTVLPAVIPTVVRHALLRLPGVALALAALGFLGLGPTPPSPDWGLVLADGVAAVERAPWVAAAPLVSLMLVSVTAVAASSLASAPGTPGRWFTGRGGASVGSGAVPTPVAATP